LVAIPEKHLMKHAESALQTPETALVQTITRIGKTAGPPWGKDQKDAALAAMTAHQ
jgi:hypothetical protein